MADSATRALGTGYAGASALLLGFVPGTLLLWQRWPLPPAVLAAIIIGLVALLRQRAARSA